MQLNRLSNTRAAKSILATMGSGAPPAAARALTPATLARDAMRQLSREKLAPTPENFARVYHALADGALLPSDAVSARLDDSAVRGGLALASALPFPEKFKQSIDQAIRKGAWHAVDGLVDSGIEHQRRKIADGGDSTASNDVEWSETSVLALACSNHLYKKTPELKRDAANLMHSIRQGTVPADHSALREKLRDFATQIGTVQNEEERTSIQLKSLLSAIVKNVAGLNAEQGWLNGQMLRVDAALTNNADGTELRNIEAVLRDAGRRQDELRHSLDDAKRALREMVDAFMGHLGEMADSTGEFSNRVSQYTVAIESADGMPAVTRIVRNLLDDTRGLHSQISDAKRRLDAARLEAAQHAAKSNALEAELCKVSELVRTDKLTRALNRDGLETAYNEETERAEQSGNTLCLALLDIDNFKTLNEKHGHQAGDDALIHLSRTIREALRPTDVLARLAGEEFVVLMPDTELDVAVGLAERLQRQLTRQFFLHGLERLFVTFSAGVARVGRDEIQQAVIDRACKALGHAKRLGKNRVCAS